VNTLDRYIIHFSVASGSVQLTEKNYEDQFYYFYSAYIVAGAGHSGRAV
jgi:hypothetical protein